MQSSAKPAVVIDTNVWISGLVFGGNPEKIIRLFIEGRIEVIISEEVLSELRRKVRQRFTLFIDQLDRLEASLREDALLVPLGLQTVSVSRDVNDNVFVETAIAGKAQYIIIGDKDLLVIGSYKNTRIVKPAEFLQLMDMAD